MPSILSDLYLTLLAPVRVFIAALGGHFNTYTADCVVGDSRLTVCVIHPVKDDYSPLLPAGTVAHVNANLTVIGRCVFLLATTVVGLRVIPGGTQGAGSKEAFDPVLSFVGKVSRSHFPDPARPSTVIIEVTVEDKGTWPGTPLAVRCFFNRDSKRFRSLLALRVGEPVDLSGRLIGWVDGRLGVEVNEARTNFSGELPPETLLALAPVFKYIHISGDRAVFHATAVNAGRFAPGNTASSGTAVSESVAAASTPGDENEDPASGSAPVDFNRAEFVGEVSV